MRFRSLWAVVLLRTVSFCIVLVISASVLWRWCWLDRFWTSAQGVSGDSQRCGCEMLCNIHDWMFFQSVIFIPERADVPEGC